MEFGITDVTTNNTYLMALNTSLNVAYILVLMLPLAAMVIVLMFRVIILWAVIALSPILVIMKVFDREKEVKKYPEHLKFGNIIKLLVAPVLISFAVSLSTMFIIILKTGVNGSNSETVCALGGGGDVLGFLDLSIQGVGANIAPLITGVLGIAIVWFLLFWAVKMNSLGGWIEQNIQKT